MSTIAVRTVSDLRHSLAPWRKAGERVALVPTMGALHEGHLSLVALAKSKADRVVASIFVNPIQFGPRDDFHRYPRDEAGDLAKLEKAGASLVFAPGTAEMYPQGFGTRVRVADLTEDLCGASRPNHFDGVATVVTKLLLQCAPDLAVFGEKDFQQLAIVRRMVFDLSAPVDVIGCEIVREPDGLAMSSRNVRLRPDERAAAPALHEALRAGAAAILAGERSADAVRALMASHSQDKRGQFVKPQVDLIEPSGDLPPAIGFQFFAAAGLGADLGGVLADAGDMRVHDVRDSFAAGHGAVLLAL
jgi:pantoate--beta-alanine ligase